MQKRRILDKWTPPVPVNQPIAVLTGIKRSEKRRLAPVPAVVRDVPVLQHWLLLGAILTMGAFLRLWQINMLGYNSDEAVYAGQGAAIAADPTLKEIFPMFRAHPLLFQYILAIVFQFGVSDMAGRLASVAIGLGTIYLVNMLGAQVYGRKAGLGAALFVALMPYHVIVTRQVLLDGPMVLCATLSLYLIAKFASTQQPEWLYAAGGAMGLTFLAKETGIILIGAIYAFLALSPEIRVRIRDLILSVASMVLIMLPFPLSLMLAGGGGSKTGQSYLVWQLSRRPNHPASFYAQNVPPALGPILIAVAVAGLLLLWHERSWREKLLVAWIVVPTVFFQLWPTKGFQYLLPTAPAFALLASRTVTRWSPLIGRKWMQLAALGMIALSLLIPSWSRVQTVVSDRFLAGSGGIPGGRDAGLWVQENLPEGAQLITVGPSMANVLQFYGYRKAFGLSVSANPLRRNPSYKPIINPDFQIRTGEMQYLVWDAFSAARSPYFAERLLEYAKRYNARVVHVETVTTRTPTGATTEMPVIIIYEAQP